MSVHPAPAWFCHQCGHPNRLEFKHCVNCGTALPSQSQLTNPLANQSVGKKTSPALIILCVILGLGFLAVAGGILAWRDLRADNQLESKPATSLPSPSPMTNSWPDLPLDRLRVRLETTYKGRMEQAHPNLNYMTSRVIKINSGYGLFVRHEGFGEYTLKFGQTARVVEAWINANLDDLKKAQVTRVGVENPSGAMSYFDIK